MPKVVREKEMEVGQDALYRAITEFEAYPTFLPEVVGVEVKPGATNGKHEVTFEIEVIKRFRYTLEFEITGKEQIAWRLLDSNFFKANEGKWVLKPVDSARTHVNYELEVAFGFLVPGWVTKKLTENNLPKMFESFESQAKKLQGAMA